MLIVLCIATLAVIHFDPITHLFLTVLCEHCHATVFFASNYIITLGPFLNNAAPCPPRVMTQTVLRVVGSKQLAY